jgi:PST family polysaccharide transporter
VKSLFKKGRVTDGGLLLLSNVLEALIPLSRNIGLAWLLPSDQFGLAISLSIIAAVIELVGEFGFPVYVVRKVRIAPAKAVLGTVQTLALIRAGVLAALLLVISPLAAMALHANGETWVYMSLALVVLIRGFENFGIREETRHYSYWRLAIVVICAQITAAGVTLAAAYLTGTFDAMLWGLLAGAVSTAVCSNLLSRRTYRLTYSRDVARDASSFGRPLIINGIALAVAGSDRMIVGAALGPVALARYNVALGTAVLPRWVVIKFLTSIFIPALVKAGEAADPQRRTNSLWVFSLSAVAFLYGLVLCSIGDRLLGWLFGSGYQPSRVLMCLVAVNLSIKYLMSVPLPLSYVVGRTRTVAAGSVLSAVATLIAATTFWLTSELEFFVCALTVLELVALTTYLVTYLERTTFSLQLIFSLVSAPILLLAALALVASVLGDMNLANWSITCLSVAVVGGGFYAAVAIREFPFWAAPDEVPQTETQASV